MSRIGETGVSSFELSLLDHLIEGCQVIDRDWRYIYVNAVAAAHGRASKEDLLGRTMLEVYPGIESTPMFAALRRCMDEGTSHAMENEFIFPDDTKGWFELRFEPVPMGVFILSIDITQRKRMEEQLQQAQRLESIGRLAGGISHDFNNELCVILNYAELISDQFAPDTPAREDLQEIVNAGNRAAALTRQLLAFSRRQVLQPEIISLNDVLNNLKGMLHRLLGEDIALRVSLADDLGRIKADPGQIEQVIMNLAVNARDAMPEGGRLFMETTNVELDEQYSAKHFSVKPGSYVVLAVSDSGCGMDEATRARVFDPFFTTKTHGKGTGLGLSTVFGIVAQSRGSIWVYSELGQGTTFKIYFPRDFSPQPAERVAPRPAVRSTGTETILLVEDDEAVRAVARRILVNSGYKVLTTANPGDALELASSHSETIHLLLTDVVMPTLSGRELAQRLAESRPAMRVVFMSGYTDEAMAQHGTLEPGMHLVAKPFNSTVLTRKVREALDAVPFNG